MKHKISALSGKRLLSVFLAVTLCMSMLPGTALAVQTGSTDTNRTVFDALGFDTSAPEGYQQEEGITDTPFGKTYTSLAEVDELSVFNMVNHTTLKGNQNVTLFGEKTDADNSVSDFFKDSVTKSAPVSNTPVALTVEGNFSADNNGQKKNVALFTLKLRESGQHGDLALQTATADGSRISSDALSFGDNYSGGSYTYTYKLYEFYNWYQLAAGDFDGDGIDEIALAYSSVGRYFNPLRYSSPMRISVYKLQSTDGDSYLDMSNWELQWEKSIVMSNATSGTYGWKLSMTAADVNKDGVDDLAFACSNSGDSRNANSPINNAGYKSCGTAFVAFGADNNKMLTEIVDIPVDNLYRTGLAVGDLDSDGRNELVVGGSENSSGSDRALQIFAWNGSSFDMLARTSVNPKDLDRYYNSSPALPANVAVGSFYGVGDSIGIYLDSILFKYESDGLAAQLSVRWEDEGIDGPSDWELYYEWGARAADFTGSGQELICLNYAYVPGETYLSMGPDQDWGLKQKCVFGRVSDSGVSRVWEDSPVRGSDYYFTGWQNSRAIPFCLPNTDDDTVVLRYTGEHYYTYADPEVLAVLASPPYFADLDNEDDDSPMTESTTSYGASHGSGGGSTYSNSFSIGVYTSWEKSWSMLGVELASAEAEATINNTFTWETQNTSTIEYEVEYATMAGMDAVVLYALPVETYVYEATMSDGTTQTMTVNIPYQPSVRTISAEEYSEIQKVYSDILPDVSPVLNHTVGDPASYASSVSALPSGRWQTLEFDGDFATIGQGSKSSITQTIEMTNEKENSFNYELEVEAKAGFGSAGITVGVTAGYSHGAGSVHITTSGSSYSGEMCALPTQAEQYGYSFNWKLVGYLWLGRYPVVTYLVDNVSEPPLLPERFGANEDETTTNQIALEWDYPGNAAGFIIYRYFQSPSSSGFYKIATVGSGDYQSVSNGVKHYQYIDEGLSPNTGYQYRIQTIGLSQPNTSIPSEALNTYTKPETGSPQVEVSAETLATYPDLSVSTTAYITNSDVFKNARIYYQWQKQSGSDWRDWENLDGEDAPTLTFQYPDRGVEGVYRCKVTALVDENLVAAYSPEVTVTFAQRVSEITNVTINDQTITATVNGIGTATVPSGTVNVVLTNTDGIETSYTAALDKNGKASVTVDPITDIYRVTVSYSGSKVFLPSKYDPDTPLFYAKGVESGTFYDIRETYTYGEALNFKKYTIEGSKVTSEPLSTTAEHWDFKVSSSDSSFNERQAQRVYAGYAARPSSSYHSLLYYVDPEDANTGHSVFVEDLPLTLTGLKEDIEVSHEFTDWATLHQEIREKIGVNGLLEEWADEDIKDVQSRLRFGAGGEYVFVSSNGNVREDPMAPGVYDLYFAKNSLWGYDIDTSEMTHCPGQDSGCYIIGRLIVTGPSYDVSAEVAEGQDTWGTVRIAYPENTDTASVGQTLIFQASPNQGYAVKQWYMVDANGNKTFIKDSQGQNSLTLTQTAEGTRVIVEFENKSNTLTTFVTPEGAGTITTPDKYFKNGNAYNAGYEFTFTATANEGWHFIGWECCEDGKNIIYGDQTTYTVKMPDNSVELSAKFERDTYALTLSDGLAAYVNGELVADLTTISGDTVVTVKPADGFILNEGAEWKVNGTALDPQPATGEYTFTMLADTSVSVDVTAQQFDVNLDMQGVTGGTAELTGTTDGKAAAGTQVTYNAVADRGYTFAGWKNVADNSTVSESDSYTFTVSGNVTLTPVFTEKEYKTFSVGNQIDWAITDEACDPVTTEEAKLYPGETLTLTALPRDGYMVKGWTVNSKYTADASKTKTFAYQELKSQNTFSVTFQPITYFTVEFAAGITATVDGETTITSGASVAAGSKIVFTYNGNDAVIKWFNGETELPFAKELVIDPLTSDLDIKVETGELNFYSVTDSNTPENYTAAVAGTYEGTGDNKGKFAENTSVTLTVTPADGYQITDVKFGNVEFTKDEDTGVWTGTVEKITEDITFTVTVELIPPAPVPTYTITFNANGGTLNGASITTAKTGEDGKLASMPVPTREGYTFGGWYTAKSVKVTTETEFTEDTTLFALWTKDDTPPVSGTKYTITFNANGGSVTPASAETGEDGKLTSLPKPTREDYTFDGWYTAKTGGDKVTTRTVFTEDTTIYALWTKESSGGGSSGGSSTGTLSSYSITIAKTKNGDVTASDKTAAKGDIITLKVDPDKGYILDELIVTDKRGNEIELTDKGNGKFTFKMPASKVTVEASFVKEVEETVEDNKIVLTLGSNIATVFGQTVVNDVAPIARNNRTLLPIRFVAEALGAQVDWNADLQKVTISKPDLLIEIYLGQNTAYVNGNAIVLDVTPFAENNRTYLPLRFVAETLGAEVLWDQATQSITIIPE